MNTFNRMFAARIPWISYRRLSKKRNPQNDAVFGMIFIEASGAFVNGIIGELWQGQIPPYQNERK